MFIFIRINPPKVAHNIQLYWFRYSENTLYHNTHSFLPDVGNSDGQQLYNTSDGVFLSHNPGPCYKTHQQLHPGIFVCIAQALLQIKNSIKVIFASQKRSNYI